jgi:hypothetical protein
MVEGFGKKCFTADKVYFNAIQWTLSFHNILSESENAPGGRLKSRPGAPGKYVK